MFLLYYGIKTFEKRRNEMLKYLKQKAKKALKISRLTQVRACIQMGVSVPVYKDVMNEGKMPLNNTKRKSIEKWINKQLAKESK